MGYGLYTVRGSQSAKNQFETNIWGMEILRGAMKCTKIMDNKNWPEFVEENSKEDEKHNNAILSFRSKDKEKVPLAKFYSNDGWKVVPEECLLLADALDTLLASGKKITYENIIKEKFALKPDEIAFVKEFSAFCRRASDRGGFIVT